MRSVVVSLLLTIRVALRDRAVLQLEILALRQKLHVLNRSRPQRLEVLEAGHRRQSRTVAKYMIRRRRPPSQTWRTFLANHVDQIVAADFFVVPTVTYRLLFVLVILAHHRRGVVHVGVTAHPTAVWTATTPRGVS